MHFLRKKTEFKLKTNIEPKGDQPKAIEELVKGVKNGLKHQVLLGVTGSGKTSQRNPYREVE